MDIIICVDKNMGILFNNRRVSRDSAIIRDILYNTDKLYVSTYSAKLFTGADVIVFDTPPDPDEDGTILIEDTDPSPYLNTAQKLVIYSFNRAYPSDVRLNIDPNGLRLISSEDFKGTSHERITKSIYTKAGEVV